MTNRLSDGSSNEVVNWSKLAHWMEGNGIGEGPLTQQTALRGGTQNVMFSFLRQDRKYVLRRGPEHLRPQSNDIMRREMQLTAALSSTDVPHARLIAGCTDESVLNGAAFYLMEPVDGYNPVGMLPPVALNDSEFRHRMSLALIDSLTTLAAVDHHAVGLSDFGRPNGFLERQVPRWMAELDSYANLPGYPGPDFAGPGEVAQWLEENRPTSFIPGVLHGDFYFSNVMYRWKSPDVAAIVDWEMTTIGDPLLDLGWVLALWPAIGGQVDLIDSFYSRCGSLATESELIARYADRSTRDLRAIDWYVVLACFKLGIVLEGSYARSLAGRATSSVGNRLHSITLALFERALGRIRQ